MIISWPPPSPCTSEIHTSRRIGVPRGPSCAEDPWNLPQACLQRVRLSKMITVEYLRHNHLRTASRPQIAEFYRGSQDDCHISSWPWGHTCSGRCTARLLPVTPLSESSTPPCVRLEGATLRQLDGCFGAVILLFTSTSA